MNTKRTRNIYFDETGSKQNQRPRTQARDGGGCCEVNDRDL